MLTMVAIGAPLVLGYTLFVYRTFRGKGQLDQTSYWKSRLQNPSSGKIRNGPKGSTTGISQACSNK